MGETPNWRVRRDAESRQEKCVYIRKSLPRTDWSARLRTRDIDWLGTTPTHARMVVPERSEVADAYVVDLISVLHKFSRRLQRRGRHNIQTKCSPHLLLKSSLRFHSVSSIHLHIYCRAIPISPAFGNNFIFVSF